MAISKKFTNIINTMNSIIRKDDIVIPIPANRKLIDKDNYSLQLRHLVLELQLPYMTANDVVDFNWERQR